MLINEGNRRFVAYYRVSTQRQGRSGLGLEAQEAAVVNFVNGHGELVASHTEVESGKKTDRPELAKAIAQVKRTRATLVIAKLDRLARNVAFVSALMESKIDFVACDNPHASPLTIHILAAVAEDEARRTAERTKAALQAYKARGGKLGAQDPRCKQLSATARKRGNERGCARNRANAQAAYTDLLPIIEDMRLAGASYREISRRLNLLGHTTRTGRPWNPAQVYRVVTRRNGRQGS